MPELKTLVDDFLSQRHIAVVGVSEKRDTGCNLAWERFKQCGYRVSAVSPHLTAFKGEPCYPDLKSIPSKPDAVFILARPSVTEDIVDQCAALGIRHVWMHCMMGTKPGLAKAMTSVSAAAVEACRKHGIQVIPGSCPNQFLKPDMAHGLMRRVWGMLGFLKMPASAA